MYNGHINKGVLVNVIKINSIVLDESINTGTRSGLDNHTDKFCAGRHAKMLEYIEGRLTDVKPLNDSYKSINNVKTANVT